MRYIPLTEADKKEMLASVGVKSVERLFDTIPPEIRLNGKLDLPEAMPEQNLARHIKKIAAENIPATGSPSFLGAGAYNHFVPSAVDHLISRSEFYSSYTPYQPEISQGTLQGIYEFQTHVCNLFAMDVANASMYDGASALAEAVLMACRVKRKNEIVVSNLVHPAWRKVVKSYTHNRGIKIVETEDHEEGKADPQRIAKLITEDTAAIVVQSPNFFGNIETLSAFGELCSKKKILFIAAVAEPISLGLLKPPGECGADIVVGEGQALGLGLSFGGPYLGLFATRDKYLRQMPGRLCGRTVDSDGKPGFVLTLVTREQHIRREKATSNICSNQALCALASTIYMTLMGKEGLAQLARENFYAAAELKRRIEASKNLKLSFDLPFFNEFTVTLNRSAKEVNKKLAENGIIGGFDMSRIFPEMKNRMLFAMTEQTEPEDIDKLMETLEG